jgi:hypothetical protein
MALFITLNCLGNETLNIKYGEWKMTQKMNMANLPIKIPSQPAQTDKQCLTEESVKKGFGKMKDLKDCKITKNIITENTITWEALCVKSGQKTTIKSLINYKKTSLTGKISFSIMGMNMTTNITGKYIGPCKK